MPIEPTSSDIPQQIEYLWGLKSAITYSDIVPVIVSLLESPLENLENESFTEDDWKLVQLVLTLFRNLLAIQDISVQQKAGGAATQFIFLRDKFLELLFKENVMDLILVLSQHCGGSHGYLRQDNLLLMEIFYYIFKGQDPELIAKYNLNGSKGEGDSESSVSGLYSIMRDEQEKRRLSRFHNLSCYSKFSGTYTRLTVDGSKALLIGNPSVSDATLLKSQKNFRGPSKRKIWDNGELPSSKSQVLQLIDGFTSQFLLGGYNVLMQSIREDIELDHQEMQSNDIVMFFQVAQFVTSFQYHKCLISKPGTVAENESPGLCHDDNTLFRGSMCGPIAETLNEPMFFMVISKWREAFEGLKQTNDFKFLSAAGSLLRILIRMLDLVLKQSPEDSKEPQTARILLYKLFYDQTEEGATKFLLNLIKSFDALKQSKSDLANLVESMHVILRLMENLEKRGTLRVSKKSRKKKNKSVAKSENACEPSLDNAAGENDVSIPTKETTDVNMVEKEILMHQHSDIEADKSMGNFVQADEPVEMPPNQGVNESEVEKINNMFDNDGHLKTDNSSSDEQPVMTNEVDFKVSSFVSSLANNSIIQKLCWLLKFYKSNSIQTNHFIISMLKRICDDLELSPMLYQLSYLTIFYDILEEQKSKPCQEYENIVNFLTTLIRRMLRKMKSYPLLLVEVLFLKTRKECHYINCESMLTELRSMRNGIGEGKSGTKDNGNIQGQKWVPRSIADALGDDDFDVSFPENQEKVHSEEEPNGSPKMDNDLILSNEMEGNLKHLYEKYKDNPNCCELIAEELDPSEKISKMQVSRTLKQWGLKAPAKAKRQRSDASSQLGLKKRDLSSSSIHNSVSNVDGSSSPRKPVNSRKRVQAFSTDQEQKIKDLFEQFKDHKKCSFMIANALDDTGMISAARVSRKLKQLGLVVPKRKTSHATMHLRDEVLSDVDCEAADETDDETLLSLRIKGKQKRNEKEVEHNKKIAQKLQDEVSDDELLSSLLVKTKKVHSEGDHEDLVTDSFEKNFAGTNSTGMDSQFSKRDGDVQSSPIAAAETEGGFIDKNNAEAADVNESRDSLLDDLIDDDFEESVGGVATQGNNWSRKRRMVMDDFDDE